MSETQTSEYDDFGRREGAQPGNTNRVTHGGRSQRFGIVLARLGRKFRTSYVDVLRLRRELETILRQQHGELTLLQIARIQTVARLEQSSRALELSIREDQNMAPDALRLARHQIVQWSCQRDRILSELLGGNVGADGTDPWATLDATPPESPQDGHQSDPTPQPDPEPMTGTSDASETIPDDEGPAE